MAYQESIMLFYASMTFLFGIIAYLLDDSKIQYLIPKILFLALTFLFALNGVTTAQSFLDNENFTTSPINETIYASISNKFDASYTNLLWSFVIIFAWIVILLAVKGKDVVIEQIEKLRVKQKRRKWR